MEVPSTRGRDAVHDVKVRVGDQVSQGTVLLTIATHRTAPQRRPSAHARRCHPATTAVTPAPQRRMSCTTVARSRRTIDLVVPDIGDFKDVPVVEVLVKPGQTIAKEAPLVVLESEKASMEVPASAAGTIADRQRQTRRQSLARQRHRNAAERRATGNANRTGAIANAVPPAHQTPPQRRNPCRQPARQPWGVHASPAIRRFARELGVESRRSARQRPARTHHARRRARLRQVRTAARRAAERAAWRWRRLTAVAEGRFRAVRRDRTQAAAAASRSSPARTCTATGCRFRTSRTTTRPTSPISKRSATRSTPSKANAAAPKLTMLAFLIKASVAALQRFPEFNASLDGDELVYKRYYNVGFAADTPNGLVVPVLKGADAKGLLAIAAETAELAGQGARRKTWAGRHAGRNVHDLVDRRDRRHRVHADRQRARGCDPRRGSRIATKPVWNGSEFVPRLMLPISVSYDHRVVDGAGAARFLVLRRARCSAISNASRFSFASS